MCGSENRGNEAEDEETEGAYKEDEEAKEDDDKNGG